MTHIIFSGAKRSSAAWGGAAAALAVCLPAAAEERTALPDLAQALLDAAYESSDANEIAAVAKAVKAVFPDYADAIEAQAAATVAGLTPLETGDGATLAEAGGEKNDAEEEGDEGDGGEGAEETDAPPPRYSLLAVRPWDGDIKVSAVFSSGNSENSAVGISFDTARIGGDFTHNLKGYFDLGQSGGETNQRRWGAAYQLDYNFGERTYAYGRFSYDEDEFSGFDYRLFAGAGLGHHYFLSDALTWKVEAGPGYRYSPIDDTREVEQQVAVYAASETDWLIREGVLFEQDFTVTWSSPTTTVESITSLKTDLTESLSTAVSFEYRFETDPPQNRENTDTIARASLVYGF